VATAFKLALAEVDTYQLVFYSTLTAAFALLVIVAAQGKLSSLPFIFRSHWRITLIAGLMNPVIYYLVLFQAYDMLPAQVALSINYTWAIVLTLMAVVFLEQKILAADFTAAAVCYGGVVIIATQGEFTSFSRADPVGVGLALLSTVIWAGYWTLNVRDSREPLVGLCLNFMVALPIALVVCLFMSDLSISGRGALGAAYVGIVEMAVAFVFWSSALKLTSNASRISNLIFLSPFISLVIVNQVLGETIYPTTLAGLLLIVGGLLYQQAVHGRQPDA
jgi:drug/metabolite transporter (DMT)-like permease